MGVGPVEPNLPPRQIRVENKEWNDPRVEFRPHTSNFDRSPVCIRFEPKASASTSTYQPQTVMHVTPTAKAKYSRTRAANVCLHSDPSHPFALRHRDLSRDLGSARG